MITLLFFPMMAGYMQLANAQMALAETIFGSMTFSAGLTMSFVSPARKRPDIKLVAYNRFRKASRSRAVLTVVH